MAMIRDFPDFAALENTFQVRHACFMGMVRPPGDWLQSQAVQAICRLNLTYNGDTKPSMRRDIFLRDNGDLNGENSI